MAGEADGGVLSLIYGLNNIGSEEVSPETEIAPEVEAEPAA